MPRMRPVDRVQAGLLRGLMALPEGAVRRLAGRPIHADGATLSPQSQLVLRLERLTRQPSVASLDIPEGRLLLLRQSAIVGGRQPIGGVQERTVRGAEGPLPARLYVPTGAAPVTPLLVFFHGGGMIYGDLDSHDAVCRFLAERSGVRVLAVEYRLAPEHAFPAGVDDASAAFAWISDRAADFGADPERLAVGGDSAGGYLAAATAIRAAEEGRPLAYQMLVYPMADCGGGSASRAAFAQDLYLTAEFIELANKSYWAGTDAKNPRLSVQYAEIPDGVAPALVATAGFDPLRDEGEAYARKLEAAGVKVDQRRYAGEIHGFFNVVGVPGSARDAAADIADALRTALTRIDP